MSGHNHIIVFKCQELKILRNMLVILKIRDIKGEVRL
jgi:hypothetical protein